MDPVSDEELQEVAAFWEALRTFVAHAERACRSHGLTPQRYRLLVMILGSADGETTVTSLRRRLHVAQSSATELVDGAVRAGLVERVPDRRDGRVSHLRATDEGARRARSVIAELRAERAGLRDLLQELVRRGP